MKIDDLKAGQLLKAECRDHWRNKCMDCMTGRREEFYLVKETSCGERYVRLIKVENYGRPDMTYDFIDKKRISPKKVIDLITEIWELDGAGKWSLVWNGLKTISNSQASITYQTENNTVITVKFAEDSKGKTVDLNDISGSEILERLFNQITGPCPDVIILPKNIREIGEGVFYGSKAAKIVIPEVAEKVGDFCFARSDAQQIDGFNVKKVGKEAFWGCENLKTFTWSARCNCIPSCCFGYSAIKELSGTEKVSKLEDEVFFGCKNLSRFIWPARCKKIPDGCFSNSGLETLTGTEKVTSVGMRAFSGCKKLTEFCWPRGASQIGCCFDGSGIEKLTGTEDVTLIGYRTFQGCKKLKHFDFNEKMMFGDDCFYESGLESVSNLNLTQEWSHTFRGCDLSKSYKNIKTDYVSLTYLDGSNIITGIEFLPACRGKTVDMNDIPGIENLTIIKLNLTGENYYDDGKIKGTEYLMSLILPQNLLNLPRRAFMNSTCSEIVIPESIHKIPQHCFDGSAISKIEGMEHITSVGEYAFNKCRNLKKITIAPQCELGTGSFKESGLEEVTVQDDTAIGVQSFSSCRNLRSVVGIKDMDYVGTGAFSGCDLLPKSCLPLH